MNRCVLDFQRTPDRFVDLDSTRSGAGRAGAAVRWLVGLPGNIRLTNSLRYINEFVRLLPGRKIADISGEFEISIEILVQQHAKCVDRSYLVVQGTVIYFGEEISIENSHPLPQVLGIRVRKFVVQQ